MDKMENMNDSLWERIESLMKSRNLNQKEFAAKIGVNAVTITEWKKGKSRSYQKIDVMRRIADALGVSVEKLTQENPIALVDSTSDMFWQNFVRLCSKVNKSPARVANELGLSNAVTTSWKRGTMPRDSTLFQIAEYFSVPVESLTAETPPAVGEKKPSAPKYESERKEASTDTIAQIIETARRLQPVQQEFLLAFLRTVVQNAPAETPQGQRSWTVSQAAVAAGEPTVNANIHP